MELFKKSLTVAVKLFLLLFGSAMVYTCTAVPKVSKESKKIIAHVLDRPLPEIVKGPTGYARSQKWKIWYENIPPKTIQKGTVVLIMGAANDALSWPLDFISHLTAAGYRVIRYDHRGTGLTSSEESWDRKNWYTLEDMAQDPITILDTLAIQKAHFVGASMGGMIAQIIAIEHPERTQSLTSIMSAADVFDTLLPPMNSEILPKMISAVIKHGVLGGKKGKIKLQVVQKKILMGKATGEIDVKPLAEAALYNLKKRDGYHFISSRHHQKAIENSSSRYDALSKLKVPVLIVHGKEDPVIPIEHGQKMASLIPNVDSLWLKNMGHDLPDALIDTICKKMILNFERSE